MAVKNKILESIVGKAPVIVDDSRAARDAATGRQIQQALGQAQPTGGVVAQSQAVGAAATAQDQQNQLASAQQGATLQNQIVQQDLAATEQAGQAELSQKSRTQDEAAHKAALAQSEQQQSAEISQRKQFTRQEIEAQKSLQDLGFSYDNRASFLSQKQRAQLQELGNDVKDQLFDARLRFETDENGRKFSNERQLADWAVVSANSEQQARQRLAEMQNIANKEIIMLEAANKRLIQELSQESQSKIQGADQKQRRELLLAQQALAREIERKKNRAKNKSMIGGAIGTVVGAAVGAYAGSPAAGAAIGGGLGTAAGAAT